MGRLLHTTKAAATVDGGHDIRRRILALIDSADARGGFVASIIGRELGCPDLLAVTRRQQTRGRVLCASV